MLNVANNINEAWLRPSRQLETKITMNGEVYDNSSITSFSFDSGSISGESFQIGSAYMNQVQIIFPSVISTVNKDQEITIEVGILVDGTYHYSKLGKFIISEFDRNQNDKTTTITAVDQMILLEGPYVSKLSYPARIRDVALEIANLAGVAIDQTSFSTLPTTTIKKPGGYTYRQAIGLIAQFEGGFANFNRDGKLQVRRLASTTFTITPDNYQLKGFTKNETTYRPNGIVVRTGDEESDVLKVGATSGNIIELENKVMTQALLNTVWNRVKDISYFPYEVKWQGNPNLEAGDWFYIVDREGNRYSVPNLSFSFNYNGGMSAESKAITTSNSEVTYRYRGSLKQQIEEIKGILEGANGWNSNYYDSETEPPNPKIGDLWFKKNGADNEIWIYRLADGVAKWELEISSAPNQELLDAIQEAIDASNAAKQAGEEAKEAGERAEQLGNEAKQAGEEAKQAGLEAKAEAELAKQAGEEAKTAGQRAETLAGQAKTESATAISNANNAVSKANQAVEDAGFSKTQAQEAKSLADAAKQDALNAVTQSATAKQIAESASSAVSSAVTTANQAKQDAINAVGQSATAISNAQAALDAYNNMEVGGRNWLLDTGKSLSLTGENKTNQTLPPLYFSKSPLNAFASAGDFIVFSADVKITGSSFSGDFKFQTISGVWANISGTQNIVKEETIKIRNVYQLTDLLMNDLLRGVQFRGDNIPTTVSLEITNIQWEIGNIATPWTPAPEDVQVQITDINGELSQKVSQTTFDTLQGTVSNQGTQINQNKSDISLKASQSTVNTLTGRVSTAEGQISTQAGQISQRLTATQVESLVNGKGYATQSSVNSQVSTINGKLNEHTSQLSTVTATVNNISAANPNLLVRKGEVLDTWFDVDGNAVAAPLSYTQARSTTWIRVTPGTSLTFSQIKIGSNADNYFRFIFQDQDGNIVQRVANDAVDFTITVPQNASHLRVSYQRNNKVKVENGNKVTDWIPAVEDVASDIDLITKTNTINQRISETENNITAVVNTTSTQGSKITSLESKLTLAEGAITATNTKVTSNTTQIGTLQSSFSGLQSTVSSVRNDLDNLDVNDRNLHKSTSDQPKTVNISGWTHYPLGSNYLMDAVAGETYTARVYYSNVGSNSSGSLRFFWKRADGSLISESISGNWISSGQQGYSTLTVTAPAGTVYMTVGLRNIANTTNSVTYKEVKVQKGNKATQWTPSFEDVTSVTQFSDFKQTVEGFTTSVNNSLSGLTTQQSTLSGQITSLITQTKDIVNLFKDPTFTTITEDGSDSTGWSSTNTTGAGRVWTNKTGARNSFYFNSPSKSILLEAGKYYSIKVKVNSGGEWDLEIGTSGGENIVEKVSSASTWITGTIKTNTNVALRFWVPNNTALRIHELYVYESATGVTSDAFNSIKSTVAGTTQTIQNHNGRITTAQQTADGAKTTATDAQGRVATVEQKVTGLQTTVADKADKSQITQLAGQISSVVSDVSNLSSSGDNLIMNGGFENGHLGWNENVGTLSMYPYSGVYGMVFQSVSSNGVQKALKTPIPVVPGRKYEFSYWYQTSTDANGTATNQKLRISDVNNTLITAYGWSGVQASWKQNVNIWECPSGITAIRLQIVANNSQGWVRWDDVSMVDVTDREWNSTQITQLSNNINLRLTQSQVNQSILADKKFKDTRSDNQSPSWYFTNYPQQVAKEFKTASVIGLTGVGTYATLDTDVPWPSNAGGKITQTAKTDSGVYQRFNTNDSTWGVWAKIADTSNVVTQINLSTEGVLIQGKKITIDGETYITNGVIKNAHIADLAVTNAKLANLSVSEAKIANAAITTLKVADAAISNAKIANLAVDGAKIALLAVDTGHIKDLAVSNAKIANLAVSNAKIADAAITSAKIGDAAIVNAKIANGAIDNAKIQDASISSAKISSIDAGKIVTGELRGITIISESGGDRTVIQGGIVTSTGRFNRVFNDGRTAQYQTQQKSDSGYFKVTVTNKTTTSGGSLTGGEVQDHRSLLLTDKGISTQIDAFTNSSNQNGRYIDLFANEKYNSGFVGSGMKIYSDGDMEIEAMNLSIWGRIAANFTIKRGTDSPQSVYWNDSGTGDFSNTNLERLRANGIQTIEGNDQAGFHIGSTEGVRITDRRGYNNGNRVYKDIYAANFRNGSDGMPAYINYSGSRNFANAEATKLSAEGIMSSNTTRFFVGTANGVAITNRLGWNNGGDVGYQPIVASAFNNGSLADYKQNIHRFQRSAVDIIQATTVYEYELKEAPGKQEIGLVIGDGYNAPDIVVDGDAVNQYRMTSLAWKAIQELNRDTKQSIQQIKNDNFNRDFEIQKLKFEIQKLNMEIESLRQTA